MPKLATLRRRAQRARVKARTERRLSGTFTPGFIDKVSEILKDIYLPAIQAKLESESFLLKYLEGSKGEFSGNYYIEIPASLRGSV